MGEADSLLNWTPIAKSEVGNWTEEGAAKVSSSTQTRDSHNRRPHTSEDTEKMKRALDDRIREANIPYVERPQYREMLYSMSTAFFFLEAFCDISHRLGGITPFGVFSDAFPGLKMWVTFCQQHSVQTKWTLGEQTLWKVTLT
jgi:hypothetical protein